MRPRELLACGRPRWADARANRSSLFFGFKTMITFYLKRTSGTVEVVVVIELSVDNANEDFGTVCSSGIPIGKKANSPSLK